MIFYRGEGSSSLPDWQKVDKGHGRLELRRLWIVPCEADMQAYLEGTFGWPKVQWCGWIERRRRPLWASEWTDVKVHVWMAGGAFEWPLSAKLDF
ncbi:MAG: hypothetical protein J7M34_06250 [Anaerolineae bacterium]|nr:hypothetical protein [Anaerolineae bacterium]